jgi:RimJ/RimL family protein N-acetyltransferase
MWRQKHADAFATVFKVTRDGTEKWLRAQMLDNPDRILFMIEADKEQPIGHLGLVVEDFEGNWAEVDNVIRGEEAGARGVMTHSLRTLCGWAFDVLRLSALRLRVFADNDRAIRLYERCGFRETERIPVARVESEGVTRWLPASGDQQSERCFSLMALENAPARHPPHQGW